MLLSYRINKRASLSDAPIDLDEVKVHLRLFGDDSVTDEYLQGLILAAMSMTSSIIGESVAPQGYTAYFTNFNDLKLPHDDVMEIEDINYYDAKDVLIEVDTDAYLLDQSSGIPEVRVRPSHIFPSSVSPFRSGPVEVKYRTMLGWTADTIPDEVIQAILIITADMYNNQESLTGAGQMEAPTAAKRLLSAYRRQRW